jgi:hypothetical protein
VLLAAVSACTYHRAYFSYEDKGDEFPIRTDGWEGVRLGRVYASEGGAIWKDCTPIAEAAVWVLMDQTRKLGGNAIGEIHWFPDNPNRTTADPVCKQGWGWFLVWPVLATPAFQRARVEAVAYRIDDPAATQSGMYLIPVSVDEQRLLAARIVAEEAGEFVVISPRFVRKAVLTLDKTIPVRDARNASTGARAAEPLQSPPVPAPRQQGLCGTGS